MCSMHIHPSLMALAPTVKPRKRNMEVREAMIQPNGLPSL